MILQPTIPLHIFTTLKMKLRRSPRNHCPTFFKGDGCIELILNAKYNCKRNKFILLVTWVGMDGEYWLPIENLDAPLESFPFLDPITREEALRNYEKYIKKALSG